MDKEAKNKVLNTILNKWMVKKEGDGSLTFVKHLKSEKRRKILEIILGNNEYDGVYELEVDKYFEGYINDKKKEVVLSCKVNLDYALFKKANPEGYLSPNCCKSFGICVIRGEYQSEATFKKALLDTNLITPEEYNLYTSKNLPYDNLMNFKYC